MAINFPSTTGQPTNGSFTHIVGNVTYRWNGVSWNAAVASGSGILFNDPSPMLANNLQLNGYNIVDNIGTSDINIGGGITVAGGDSTSWNAAYGWGDHAGAGYLTTYTETDPVFSASDAANVTAAKITEWDTAYGWGDHSSAGYLSSIGSINDHTDVTITTPANGEVLKYNGSAWVNDTDNGGGTSSIDLSLSVNKPSIYPVKVPINPDSSGNSTFTRESFYEWYGGALASNGNIYGAPYGSNKILKIDTATKTATTITVSGLSLNNQSYGGAVAHPNGKIYFIPMDQGNVLKFDPVTETMSTFASNIPSITTGWGTGIVAPNGHIYCAPLGSNQILKIDVVNETASLFGDTGYIGLLADANQANGDTGSSKFCGAHLVGNKIYLVPSSANDEVVLSTTSPNQKWIVGIIDTTNDSLDVTSFKFGESELPQIDNHAGTSNNGGNSTNGANISYVFKSSVSGPDSKIYCIPDSYPWVCVIDPINNSISRMNNDPVGTVTGSGASTVFGRTDRPGGGGSYEGDFDFHGGTLAANNKIYCNRKGGWTTSPSDNKILEIDPATQSWKYISQPTTLADGQVVDSTFWFPVTILGADGAIYGIPYFKDFGGGSAGQNGGMYLLDDPLYWQPPAASLPAPWTLISNQNGVL